MLASVWPARESSLVQGVLSTYFLQKYDIGLKASN